MDEGREASVCLLIYWKVSCGLAPFLNRNVSSKRYVCSWYEQRSVRLILFFKSVFTPLLAWYCCKRFKIGGEETRGRVAGEQSEEMELE